MVMPIGAPNMKSIKNISIFGSFMLAFLEWNELPVAKERGIVWITVERVVIMIVMVLLFTPIAIPSVSWWKNRNVAKANWEVLLLDVEIWVCSFSVS